MNEYTSSKISALSSTHNCSFPNKPCSLDIHYPHAKNVKISLIKKSLKNPLFSNASKMGLNHPFKGISTSFSLYNFLSKARK